VHLLNLSINGYYCIIAIMKEHGTRETAMGSWDALPHQRNAIRDIERHFEDGYTNGYVEMATSTGKSFLIARLAQEFAQRDMRVLILVPQVVIGDQFSNNPDKGLLKFAPDIEEIGRHYGGSRATAEDGVVVSTYSSLNSNRFTELGKFDVVLADEAHRSLGEVTSGNLSDFCPDAIKIGFTATPAYSEDRGIDQIFERRIHSVDLKEAVEMDLVAPVQCLVFTTDAEIPQLNYYADFSQNELNRLVDLRSRNESVAEFAKNFVADGRQGIVSCVPGENLLHARTLAATVDGQTVNLKNGEQKTLKAVAVGSHQTPQERAIALEEFEKGEIDVLTFVSSISEGWDSNRASFLINACPTTSKLKQTQLMGRVMRKKPDSLDSIVVDFLDHSAGKLQITSLDVLGQQHIDLGKVISQNSHPFNGRKSYLAGILNPELWHNLQMHEGALVSELTVGKKPMSEEERLIAKWDQTLAREGMPGEPEDNLGVPASYVRETRNFIRGYINQNGIDPSEQDVAEFLVKFRKNTEENRKLAVLALDNFRPVLNGLMPVGTEIGYDGDEIFDSVDESVDINRMLGQLAGRELKVIRLRFGLNGEDPLTFEGVGQKVGVTRERIRQVEAKALAKLKSIPGNHKGYEVPDRGTLLGERSIHIQKTVEYADRMIKFYTTRLGAHGSNASLDFFEDKIAKQNEHDVYTCLLHIRSLAFLKEIQSVQLEYMKQYGDTSSLYHLDQGRIEQCVNEFAAAHSANGAETMKMSLGLLADLRHGFMQYTNSGRRYIDQNPDVWLREFTESLLD
jgi:superfamily II DNA or RNA helicase